MVRGTGHVESSEKTLDADTTLILNKIKGNYGARLLLSTIIEEELEI